MIELMSVVSTANVAVGPRFLDGVVWLGVAAVIVTVIGAAILVAYALAAGILRVWHR